MVTTESESGNDRDLYGAVAGRTRTGCGPIEDALVGCLSAEEEGPTGTREAGLEWLLGEPETDSAHSAGASWKEQLESQGGVEIV